MITEEDEDRKEAFKYTRGEGPSVPWTKGIGTEECKTIFHGESETDYQGRCVASLSVCSRGYVRLWAVEG